MSDLRRPVNIMEGHPKPFNHFERIRYYIDCPVDSFVNENACERIEIPRALAKYIQELEQEASQAQHKLAALLKENDNG